MCQWCSVNGSAIENSIYYKGCCLVLNNIFNQSINQTSIMTGSDQSWSVYLLNGMLCLTNVFTYNYICISLYTILCRTVKHNGRTCTTFTYCHICSLMLENCSVPHMLVALVVNLFPNILATRGLYIHVYIVNKTQLELKLDGDIRPAHVTYHVTYQVDLTNVLYKGK